MSILLQAFARLPEQTEPAADNTDTVLLLIFIGTLVVIGIVCSVRERLAYRLGYRDGLAEGRAEGGETAAREAPAVKIEPRTWRPKRRA